MSRSQISSPGFRPPAGEPPQPAFTEVIAGIDFGRGGQCAVDLARRLTLPGGRITLVHVVLMGGEIEWRADQHALLAAQGRSMWLLDRERRLAELTDEDASRRRATHTIVAGSTGRGLAHVAHGLRADLVVIGQPHRRWWRSEVPTQLARGAWVVALAAPGGTATFR